MLARNAAAVVAILLLVAACGDAEEGSTGAGSDDVLVGCPFGPFFPAATLEAAPPLASTSDHPAVEPVLQSWLASDEGAFWAQTDWRLLELSPDAVLFVYPGTDPEFRSVQFVSGARGEDGWSWDGASVPNDCELTVRPDPGESVVAWELDPNEPPDPDSVAFVVLATEMSCASGQAMGDRLREPQVVERATEVLLVLSADPLSGDQNCPSNPSTRVEIELSAPLGDRAVVDGRNAGLGSLAAVLQELIAAEES